MDSTGSGEKSSHQKSLASATPGIPTQEEVLHIYRNVCQLTDIERYLNILYTPFSCLATTTSKYDLWELETFIPHARYDPERHLAVSVNRLMPVTSLKIYPNGNIYCQGFNRDATRRGVINIIEELRDLGYNCRLRRCQFNVVNATFSVPFHLNLDQLHLQNPSFAQYDPIKKPFVTYTLWGTMVKFAIFPTGYVYVMSASTRGLVKLAISKLLPILYCYKGSEQDESEQSLTCGDINYKLLWEKYFQENDPSD
ncbi:TATA-box-binding protein [Drosophila elegans]|uniref:TATA-box-binding protein n=1 Tax=Drosophila elegans TaxID=30023 RepID=UPI0007E8A14B|nr:TATA-box-binding protein [Drosophila elegans]